MPSEWMVKEKQEIAMASKKGRTFVGPRLFPHQLAVTKEICDKRGTGRICVVKSHRQAGKSFMCEGILLSYALNYAGSRNAMISPTLNQSRQIYKEIIKAIGDSGVVRKKNETLLEIELINGSVIFFKSAEQKDGLRGNHIDGILILDEAAYLSEDIGQLVMPWTQVAKAPVLIVSTPKFKIGLFWRYYLMGLNREHNVISIDWSRYDTSALLSEEQKMMYKRMLPKSQYKSEIEGEFLDSDGLVFEHLEENIGTFSNFRDFKYLYVGIDWATGNGGDSTSVSAFNEHGEMVFIKYFNDKSSNEQIYYISEILKPYIGKIRCIMAETNSIGTPMIDNLKKVPVIGKLVKGFTTTNSEKIKLVNQMQVALEQNKILLLDDERLLNELKIYEATYNIKTNNITYNAPLGAHDDTVMSTLIGWECFLTSTKRGHYSIGYIKR